jgi:hypothetical protein
MRFRYYSIFLYLQDNIQKETVVFDVFDRYPSGYIFPLILDPGYTKYKVLYLLVNLFEELFSKNADLLVNVSEGLLRTFRRRPKYCAIMIINRPEDHTIDRVK